MKCPICGKTSEPRPGNPAGPFCSPRCKQIDLGKWLTGEYRVPVDDDAESDGDEAASEVDRARRYDA